MNLGLGLFLQDSRPRRSGQDGSGISFLPGEIIDDGEFVTPPTVVAIASGIQFNGKKTSGASGKFIYDVGVAAANTSYTMRYDPDFSRLANGGVTAMVGFGFRTGNDFHLVGLRGDGGSGLVEHRVHGTSPDGWNKNTGHTSVSGAAAANGTQAGPNYVRITTSSDGSTYTFSTSSDGSTWTDEFTGITPTPFSAATAAAQFGIAVYLQAADAGEFSIDITLWQSGTAASAAKVLTFQTSAVNTGDLTTYTFAAQAIGTASADRRVHVGVGGTQGTRTISSVTIGGVTATQNVQLQGGVSTAAIYTANVPSGTTADIVVTWSGAQSRCGIGVWTSTGLVSDAANATDSGVNDTGNSQDLNCDVATLNGGFIIAYGVHHNSGAGGTITYSPVAITHRFFTVVESTVAHYGGSGETDGATFDVRTVSSVGTTNGNSPLVAASF